MSYRLRYKGCVDGEQNFTDEDTLDNRFGSKLGNVEELAIHSCVEVNILIAVAERILEKH